jgi:VWFA-related protein
MTVTIAAQQTFRTQIDLVHFGVVVTDKQGAPITGLTADDFEVKEAGKPQAIKFFAAGNPETAPPLHIGFLLDSSGSMENDIKDVRTAAVKFLNAMEQAVDITLVDFDTEVRMARYSSRDYARLIERIRGRKTDGWTALYDALGVYLSGTVDQDGQKILVMYTDGGDTRSNVSFSEVMTFVKATDVTVYAIGLLEHQPSSVKSDQRMRLQQITDATGGQAFFPFSMKEVDSAYEKILAQIRAQYSIGYLSTNEKTDGQWRKVEIKVKRPDIRIQARKGYFAPYKEASAKQR